MQQCPVCMRVFTAAKYLNSHLQQSACRNALSDQRKTKSDNTKNNTLYRYRSATPEGGILSTRNNTMHAPYTLQRPITLNAFGDQILVDESEEDLDFPQTELDEETGHFATENPGTTDYTTSNAFSLPEPGSILAGESFNVPSTSNDKILFMLKLITTVRAAGAPLCLIDTIVKIIKDEWQVGRLDITNLCTHRTAMKRIIQMFPSLPAPISVSATHERTIDEVNCGTEPPPIRFPKFSFLGQLQDLLDDHVFSDLKNLVVDPKNRWDYYKPNSCPHSNNEIQDGDWFQRIVQDVQSKPSSPKMQDFVLGIQGYVDKTGTDAYQRTAVEPFVFTLTLFTNGIRNSSKYWRVLALLPASLCQKQRKKHTFGASVRNYHLALKEALADFIHLQKNPPIVRIRLGEQFQFRKARLYWVNTIADGLANENLTGRIQNRSCSPRLSRGCHCPQHCADHSHISCNYLTQTAIECLTVAALGPSPNDTSSWNTYLQSLDTNREKKSAESFLKTRKKLAQLILNNVFGQHVVDLVWFHIDQGPNPRGCFGSTPVDPMHAFEEGIVPNIMSVILDPLSESAKATIDSLAMSIVSCNRWDPDYPRMNFSGGFSSLTQLTADEKVGKMLLLVIIMQTPLGKEIMEIRCDPTFDSQRLSMAENFSTKTTLRDQESDSENSASDDYSIDIGSTSRRYIANFEEQNKAADECLREHALHFVIPWLQQMIPFHQDIL